MKNNTYEYPKSALLGLPKDASLIMERILSNQTILKLLAYPTRDWKKQPDVTGQQIKEMFETKQISSVPKIKIDLEGKTYLRLIYGTVVRNMTNPHFRDNTFSIDIVCHYDHWDLGDFELRPYKLAGEIDSLLDGTHLTGIGVLNFVSVTPYIYDEEFGGVTLTYMAIRGDEDKKNPLPGTEIDAG